MPPASSDPVPLRHILRAWAVLPFALMLLAAAAFWERNRNKAVDRRPMLRASRLPDAYPRPRSSLRETRR
jgi:hypothetical protein